MISGLCGSFKRTERYMSRRGGVADYAFSEKDNGASAQVQRGAKITITEGKSYDRLQVDDQQHG